jgi:hypothetical protein
MIIVSIILEHLAANNIEGSSRSARDKILPFDMRIGVWVMELALIFLPSSAQLMGFAAVPGIMLPKTKNVSAQMTADKGFDTFLLFMFTLIFIISHDFANLVLCSY